MVAPCGANFELMCLFGIHMMDTGPFCLIEFPISSSGTQIGNVIVTLYPLCVFSVECKYNK